MPVAARMADATAVGVVAGDDQAPVLGPLQLDHDSRALAVDGGKVLPEPAAPGADGDHVRHTGSRGADAAQFRPGSVDDADRGDGRERDANVAVEALRLFERAHVEHDLVAVGPQVSHGGRV